MDLWEDELTLQKAAREFIGLYIVTPTARATELIIAALNHQIGKSRREVRSARSKYHPED